MHKWVLLLLLMAVAGPALGAETVLFFDPISGYDTSVTTVYYELNSEVALTQAAGGHIGVFSSYGPYSVSPPNQFVNISSGSYGQYTTIAVPKESSARYGQVMIRVAKQPSVWMRLAVCDVAAPAFPGYWDNTPEAYYDRSGPDLVWHVGGNLKYLSNGYAIDTGVAPTTIEFYDVTINYDLTNKTYEGWYNGTKLFGPQMFSNWETFGTPQSLAIGGAFWGNAPAVLDYWHWKVSEDTAYTTPGTRIITPGSLTATIVAQGYTGDIQDIGVKVEFRVGGAVGGSQRVFPDVAGKISFTGVEPATYDIAIKEAHGLRKVISNVAVVEGALTDLGTVELVNGDLDGDNAVSSTDLAIVLAGMDQAGQ